MGIGSELWFIRLKFSFTYIYNASERVIIPIGSRESNEFYTRLGVEPIRPRRISDPRCSISNAFDGDRTWEVQPEVGRIKLCDGPPERMSDLQTISTD